MATIEVGSQGERRIVSTDELMAMYFESAKRNAEMRRGLLAEEDT
jgi:hypothetical protein